MTLTVPRRAVAALFLERQLLDRPRARRLTPSSLRALAESTGGIQLDSINVLERAHYLTLWSRFGPFERERADKLVYSRRVLFEYWAHCACWVPRSHLPAWKHVMAEQEQLRPRFARWAREHPQAVTEVRERLRAHGHRSERHYKGNKTSGGGWWDWKPAAEAFQYLWFCGEALVRRRVNFEKIYDLPGRVLPEFDATPTLGREEFWRWHIQQSLRGMGVAHESDLTMYLSNPMRRPGFAPVLRAMLREGSLVEVNVEGLPPVRGTRKWVMGPQDQAALLAAGRRRRPSRGTTFLSPFDSFLWHRERVSRLFDFDYKIEVYVPAPQRLHGYYSLPLLHEGQLVGRMDAKLHRAESVLEARRLTLEGDAAKLFSKSAPPGAGDALLAGLVEALGSLRDHLGATRIRCLRVEPAAVKRVLEAGLRKI